MFSRSRTLALVGGTLGLLVAAAPARADLLGDTIDVQDLAIGDVTTNEDPGSMVVAPTAYYAPGSFNLFGGSSLAAEVTETQLIISIVNPYPDSPWTIFVDGSNQGLNELVVGFGLFDLTNPDDITEAVVDPSSTMPYTSVFLYQGGLYVDLQNLVVTEPAYTTLSLVVDVAAPAPEPGTIGLITTGFAGLVALRRRRAV